MPNEKEYLAKKSLLNTKQDLLTPGDNITIINNRISAQAPVVDVLVNNQSVIGLDNVARVNVDTVSPNPIDTPTDTLTSVEINGTVYELQGGGGNADYVELTQAEYDLLTPAEKMNGKMYFITDAGGGGSSVVPNPQGTPTDTLNTIEIDDVIYDIAGSGGGGTSGGVYTETVLWEDPNGLTFYPQSSQTITLSASIDDFDFLYLDVTKSGSPNYHNQNLIAVSSLYRDGSFNGVVCVVANVNNCPSFAVVDDTHLRLVGAASANPMVAWKVVGIKVSGNYFTPQIYSLEEREVGTWVDDKPLYQRTYSVAYTSGAGSGDHVIATISDIHHINSFGTYIEDSGYDYHIPYGQTNGSSIYYYSGDLYFSIGSSVGFGAGTLYVTIQYTKDSDVAGSGNYNSLAVPMLHYDNTEKIVGTYFGKTLYEKSYQNIAGTGTTVNVVLSDLSNIETIFIVPEGSASSDSIPFPYLHPDSTNVIGGFFSISNGVPTLSVRRGSGSSVYGLKYLTVRYTKTA